MKIHYWGTAAAEGVPGIFCDCETCNLARQHKGRRIRTRSQILINDDLLIDFGPDTYMHSLAYDYNLSKLEHVLITHPHEDHLYPEELTNRLEPYACKIATDTIVFHGAEESLDAIRRVSETNKCYKNQSRIVFDIMKPYETRQIGNYMVTPLPAMHGTKTPFVYLIEEGDRSLLVLNDTGRLGYEVYDYLNKRGILLTAISFDTCYGYANVLEKYGVADHHMGLLDNYAIKCYLDMNGRSNKNTICIATHFSHQGVDADYEKMCEHAAEYGFIVSYDGMKLEI